MRLALGLVLVPSFLLSACTDTAVAPADGPRLVGSIAPGDMTVQTLPIPSGWQGAPNAVAGSGAVFATNSGVSTKPLVAWLPPYSAIPLTIASSGAVGDAGAANGAGDVAAFPFFGGPKGAWLQTAPGSWSFVAHSYGTYPDVSAHGINDNREMSGYVTLPGTSGASAFRAVYFPSPGAIPVLLPVPAPMVGTMGHGINTAGDVVGRAHEVVGSGRNATTYLRAAVWHRTGATSWSVELLPSLYSTAGSNARGINDAGQIVGYDGPDLVRWTPNGSGGYLREKVVTSGNTQQIDACGRVVGTAPIGGKNERAFVWDGVLNVLPLPGSATKSGANDITTDLATGRGVVVGWAAKGGQASYPVRWTIPGCP